MSSLPQLEARLTHALAGSLPGIHAQLRMAPSPRVGWDPHVIPPGLRHAAALLLLYPADDRATPHILLTVRAAGLRIHTGQVALPGGAVDPDESIETAALREASEEVGVIPAAVRVLGRLTPLHIPVSGFLLHPVVGVVDQRPAFRLAEFEVARLLEVPLDRLRDPAVHARETQTRAHGDRTIDVDVPFFAIDGERVWGATAMILSEFLALAQDD